MSWGLDLKFKEGSDISVVDGCTYNLNAMFHLAGIFEVSKDLDGMRASQIRDLAIAGLKKALLFPEAFEVLNPSNQWGDFDVFLEVVMKIALTCSKHPTGTAVWNG